MSNDKKIVLPSVLAFERKLEVSDGLMYAGLYNNRTLEYATDDVKKERKLWQPIAITKRYNRSTQSSLGIKKEIDKTNANPVASGDDQAVIPSDSDTLKVSWTLRVIGKIGTPFSCNKPEFQTKIIAKTNDFKDQEAFKKLAYRYAYNIANGRFLWRNRVCAESVEIQVTANGKKLPAFNAYDFSLNDFEKNGEQIQELVEVIYQGLIDETGEKFTSIKVDAFVKLDESQQIFPSQEMNMNEKGKVLFQLNKCAALHNVKIGNAIRTIDTWYSKEVSVQKDKTTTELIILDNDSKQPIAIEPYGSVTQRGMAYRPSKDDLYTLIKKWVNEKDDDSNKINENDKNYIMANLIRGGVFGGS